MAIKEYIEKIEASGITEAPVSHAQFRSLLRSCPDIPIRAGDAAKIVGVPRHTFNRIVQRQNIERIVLPKPKTSGAPPHTRYRLHDILELAQSDPEERRRKLTDELTAKQRNQSITAAEAAELLGVHRATLRTWTREGRLRPLPWKVGRETAYSRRDIEAMIREN